MKQPPITDEAQWLSYTVPRHFIRFLRHRTSDRKLRLWACASATQRYGHKGQLAAAVALAEAWADGDRPADLKPYCEYFVCFESAWTAAYEGAVRTLEKQSSSEVKNQAVQFQLKTLHCIFGNPFRPGAVDPAWLTSTVVELAHGIYAERAFDRLPILADALQDAGCENADVLDHCRGPGPHARGCWVVDLVLGKT
jgi:hypothetical protein